MFISFENRFMDKIGKVEQRVVELEKRVEEESLSRLSQPLPIDSQDSKMIKYDNPNPKVRSNKSLEFSLAESNLEEKVKQSIYHNNWNEAFSLVLANNKKTLLIELLTHCKVPTDKLVLDCILI